MYTYIYISFNIFLNYYYYAYCKYLFLDSIMKSNVYLTLNRWWRLIFPPKIWHLMYTWGLDHHSYLLIQSKYEAQYVYKAWPVIDTCFITRTIKLSIYMRPDRSQVLVFLFQIWGLASIWDRYLTWYLQIPIFLSKISSSICTCNQYLA